MAAEIILYSEDYKPKQLELRAGQERTFPDPLGRSVDVTCLPDNSATIILSHTYNKVERRAGGILGFLGKKDVEYVEVGTSKHTLRDGMSYFVLGGGFGFIETFKVIHREGAQTP